MAEGRNSRKCFCKNEKSHKGEQQAVINFFKKPKVTDQHNDQGNSKHNQIIYKMKNREQTENKICNVKDCAEVKSNIALSVLKKILIYWSTFSGEH